VLRVTNLSDAGAGSLRAALTATGPRSVIFDVSGEIDLQSTLEIASGFLTVAGQTAPSPGITVAIVGPTGQTNNGIDVHANDILIQHIRIRAMTDPLGARRDALSIEGSRVVIDHVSVSWGNGTGKNMGTETDRFTDITISNCINSEAMPYGLLVSEGTTRFSILRCLFANNFNRNPEVKSGTSVVLVNNEIYNPGGNGRPFMGVWSNVNPTSTNPSLTSIIGNTGKLGPTGSGLAYQFAQSQADVAVGSQCYLSDNTFPFLFDFSPSNMVQVGSPPFALPSPLTLLTSDQIEAYLLVHAGARPADRDPVDTRIINGVINLLGNSLLTNESQVGGFPTLAQNTRVLSIPSNYTDILPSGYTVLEEDVLFPLARRVEGP
jgi:hypothetical protein